MQTGKYASCKYAGGNSLAYLQTCKLARLFTCILASLLLTACASPPTPSILYLDYDEEGIVQLWQTAVSPSTPIPLTDRCCSISEFAITPDGERVAYVQSGANGAGELWLMDADGGGDELLLSDSQAEYGQVVWHPDGRRLLFERYAPSPQLYWLDTMSNESVPLLENENGISQSASFSPDGKWAAYVGSPDEGIQLFELATGELRTVRSEISTAPVWSNDGQTIYFRDRAAAILHQGEETDHSKHEHSYIETIYLFSYALESGKIVQLTDGVVDDGRPALSPDGAWIAFGRKAPRTSVGRSIWMMRTDGSELRQLTATTATTHYGGLRWSADGRLLLTQVYKIDTPDEPPSLMVLDVETAVLSPIQNSGFLPLWN